MNADDIIKYHVRNAKSYHEDYLQKKRKKSPLASSYRKWRDAHLEMARYVKRLKLFASHSTLDIQKL